MSIDMHKYSANVLACLSIIVRKIVTFKWVWFPNTRKLKAFCLVISLAVCAYREHFWLASNESERDTLSRSSMEYAICIYIYIESVTFDTL